MTTKLCSRCHLLPKLPFHSYCRCCRNEYMRTHRTRHRNLSPLEKKKANTRSYANVYQRRGKLTSHPCARCHSTRSEKHHGDYNEPLTVTWLCRRCHRLLHRLRADALRRARYAELQTTLSRVLNHLENHPENAEKHGKTPASQL